MFTQRSLQEHSPSSLHFFKITLMKQWRAGTVMLSLVSSLRVFQSGPRATRFFAGEAMPLKEFLSKFDVNPRLSFWIPIVSLLIVLADRQVSLSALEDREKKIELKEEELELRELGNTKKEMTMRRWEMELMQREKEVSAILKDIKAKTSR